MRYFLTTLDRNTKYLPYITLTGGFAYTIEGQGNDYALTFSPGTLNAQDEPYNFIFPNTSGLNITGGRFNDTSYPLGQPPAIREIPTSGTYTGNSITVAALPTDIQITRTFDIQGVHSAATATVTLTCLNNIRIMPR